MTTLPLWKNQVVLAVTIFNQQKALQVQKEVTDTTNELLKKNAEMLKQGSLEVAKESERGIVEIETLQKVNTDLISTIEEDDPYPGRGQREASAGGRRAETDGNGTQAKLKEVGMMKRERRERKETVSTEKPGAAPGFFCCMRYRRILYLSVEGKRIS